LNLWRRSLADRDRQLLSLRGLCGERSSGQQAPGRDAWPLVLLLVLLFVSWVGESSLLAQDSGRKEYKAGKVYRIGRVSGASPPWTLDKEMLQVLRDHGWVEGRNLVLDYRYAEGRFDRLPALASELLRARPDVIFATGDPVFKAAKDATSTVPIVMIGCDAVAAGLIVSLARPGGNLTGITCISRDIAGKRIELLRETWPRLARLAMLYGPDDPGKVVEWKEAEAAGQAAGVGSDVRIAQPRRSGGPDRSVRRLHVHARPAARVSCRDASAAGDLRVPGIRDGGRSHVLRSKPGRNVATGRPLHRQGSNGREARRPAGRATHQARAGDQPERVGDIMLTSLCARFYERQLSLR
jgi:hypothetical protein